MESECDPIVDWDNESMELEVNGVKRSSWLFEDLSCALPDKRLHCLNVTSSGSYWRESLGGGGGKVSISGSVKNFD